MTINNIFGEKLNKRYIVFDSETCHLNLYWIENRSWQWSWIKMIDNKVLSEHDYYVKWPILNVSDDAAKVTHFSHETVNNKGQDPKIVLDKLNEWILDENNYLVAHNALNFDVYMYQIHRRNLGLDYDWSFIDRIIDTNALFKGILLGIKRSPNESLLAYQYKLASFKQKGLKSSLGVMCKHYGVDYSQLEAHNGLADVRCLCKCWSKMQLEIAL